MTHLRWDQDPDDVPDPADAAPTLPPYDGPLGDDPWAVLR